jgi:hypothetical protein
MVDDALRTLHEITTDPDAPDHARVSAAKRLVKGEGDASVAAEAATRPRTWVLIPDNGRDPGVTVLGPTPGSCTIIYDSSTPEGLADLARWKAEIAAGAMPVALPALAAKPKSTRAERLARDADRKKRFRARIAAEKAAKAA